MILSVIGQPVPLLVEPQELNSNKPVNNTNVKRISFFIVEIFKLDKFGMTKLLNEHITLVAGFYFNLK